MLAVVAGRHVLEIPRSRTSRVELAGGFPVGVAAQPRPEMPLPRLLWTIADRSADFPDLFLIVRNILTHFVISYGLAAKYRLPFPFPRGDNAPLSVNFLSKYHARLWSTFSSAWHSALPIEPFSRA
jgi:hypothetical protein